MLLVFFMLFSGSFITALADAETNEPSRVINLVYDDSGSMIVNDKGDYVDTWCQAKYALEVFAGMLGENDTLNVFYMSDFDSGTKGKAQLSLNGSAGASSNVKQVHDLVTKDLNTPFDAVRAAEAALKKKSADEKWLVVLTDGEFEDGNMPQKDIDAFFSGKSDDINVMFLGMGPSAGSIKADPGKNIYCEKAKNSKEILQKLTGIGTQVYNRDKLDVGSGNSISFDIPMKQLIVFAQGKDVSIKGINSEDGEKISGSGEPVTVQYSEVPTTNKERKRDPKKIIVDRSLKGSIATFDTKFNEGKYTVDVSGAETVEVYYKPDVDIIASLKQGDEEVTDLSNLEAGDYTIEFGLVKGGTQKKIEGSKLLGDVSYEAIVTNNGTTHDKTYNSGDTITIEEGPLAIDAVAHYLGYHTVQTHLDYSIYDNKVVGFKNADDKAHVLTSKGFKSDGPSQIEVTLDGKTPSEEQWKNFELKNLKSSVKKSNVKLGEFKIDKSETPGILEVTPTAPPKGKFSAKTYEDVDMKLSYKGKPGSETWEGKDSVKIKIDDQRSWLARHLRILVISLISGLILLLILGYVPGIKHYLPKKLKKRPLVSSKKVGSYEKPPKPTNGDFQKKKLYTFLPYAAEKGTIRYVPKGIAGAPKLQVKGSKGRRMEITNVRDFTNKKNITFDGERADRLFEDPRNQKKFVTSSGLTLTAEINGVKYTCSLNE